jgi:hypothetical protein
MRFPLVLVLTLAAGNLLAQAPVLPVNISPLDFAQTSDDGALRQHGARIIRDIHPALRIAVGVLAPGLPQYLEGYWRGYAYFAAEAASITGIVFYNAQAHNRRDRYHMIARDARRNYVLGGLRNNPGEAADPIPGGVGEYYEDLTKWPSSGDYDNEPSLDGLQPETDTRTYNGHQWEIAKINNFSGTNGGLPVARSQEEEARALAAYMSAVYPVELNWDWTGIEDTEAEYHRMFDRAEVSYRRRNKFTILLLTNHLASAIDMLILEKLNQSRRLRGSGLSLGFYPSPAPAGPFCPVSFNLSLTKRF